MNGIIRVDPTTLAVVFFIFFFLVAGFTGMWLSHVSLDISMHDTLYVVAHFHLMLSGAVLMAIFAGFYFYFYVFFGVRFSKTWAYVHLIYYTAGQWMTFIPLFWVSFSGLPRRLHDFPAVFTGWQSMATAGHFVTMVGVCCFYIMLFDAHRLGKTLTTQTLSIPRFNKRVLYYVYKITQLQLSSKTVRNIPSKGSRTVLIQKLSLLS
jgi:heme/copper-type cytochrome/quinol oxidase subunit 1